MHSEGRCTKREEWLRNTSKGHVERVNGEVRYTMTERRLGKGTKSKNYRRTKGLGIGIGKEDVSILTDGRLTNDIKGIEKRTCCQMKDR